MTRIFVAAILIVGSSGTTSYALLATFSENFGSPTLNSQLYTTASSPSYSVGPLTPGATWQLSKQAGTSTGEVAIHTRFEVSGNFTADLVVNPASLGTGEVGIRIGQENVVPWAELFCEGPSEVTSANYDFGGYGLAGIATSSQVTLEIARTGDTLDFYANSHHFSQALMTNLTGPASLTIFLRPFSGYGHFDPTIGNPDAHAAVLDQFTILANAFIAPEPSSIVLMISSLAICSALRHRKYLSHR